MVLFDQLRISDDGLRMYINAHVNTADYFTDIYMDSITIIPADKVLETDPKVPSEDYIYKKVFDDNTKEIGLVLTATDFNEQYAKSNLSSDLFFVYIKCKGTPDMCTPCTLDEEITLGVTFDEALLYQKIMQFTRELNNECEVPQNMIDLIMLWNGFRAAIETEHYVVAVDFWEKLFSSTNSITVSNKCKCNG